MHLRLVLDTIKFVTLGCQRRLRPMPGLQGLLNRLYYQAFRGAHIDAGFTSGARIPNDGVNLFGRSDDGVGGAHFKTAGAANAGGFSY